MYHQLDYISSLCLKTTTPRVLVPGLAYFSSGQEQRILIYLRCHLHDNIKVFGVIASLVNYI